MAPTRGNEATVLVESSDDQLMSALAGGSERAFDELVRRHQPRLVRLGRRALGDPARAEDMAQEALLRVLRHAPRYEPRGQFRAWLATIARRLWLGALRERARRPEAALSEGEPARVGDPEGALRLREASEALARLPPRHRTALVLKTVEGLSYRQIAGVLECAETDVANYVFRARRRLARELGEA